MAEFLMPSFPRRRESRFLNVSRALRAISKPNCGWLRPCTLGPFLLFGQKKWTKEKAARMARKPHCASRRNRRSPQLAGRKLRASGSIRSLATPPGLARCSARSDGIRTKAIPYAYVSSTLEFRYTVKCSWNK